MKRSTLIRWAVVFAFLAFASSLIAAFWINTGAGFSLLAFCLYRAALNLKEWADEKDEAP